MIQHTQNFRQTIDDSAEGINNQAQAGINVYQNYTYPLLTHLLYHS